MCVDDRRLNGTIISKRMKYLMICRLTFLYLVVEIKHLHNSQQLPYFGPQSYVGAPLSSVNEIAFSTQNATISQSTSHYLLSC